MTLFQPNDILDRQWCVVRTLGKGTCSTVYEVKSVDIRAAVKVYESDEKYLPVYYRELKILQMLHKDGQINGIVTLYSYFVHAGHPCLVFELLDCGVREILYKNNDEGLSLYALQSIARDILQTIDYIHSRGVIHADIKPANILWSAQRARIVLIDFGLCIEDGKQDYYHQIQSLCYQCPEAKRWNNLLYKSDSGVSLRCECTGAIDIWTIGCVLVYMYTARRVYNKDDIPYNGCQNCQVNESTLRCQYEALIESIIKPRDDDDVIPNYNKIITDFKDLVKSMLRCQAASRPTANEALHHPFFQHHLQARYKDMLLFPTPVLRLLNTVEQKELDDDSQYQEIFEDLKKECEKYGCVKKMVLPRQGKGVEKVYIEFEVASSCEDAQQGMMGGYFNGRTVITTYFPLNSFQHADYY